MTQEQFINVTIDLEQLNGNYKDALCYIVEAHEALLDGKKMNRKRINYLLRVYASVHFPDIEISNHDIGECIRKMQSRAIQRFLKVSECAIRVEGFRRANAMCGNGVIAKV